MFTACGYSDALHALTHDNSVKGYSQQYFYAELIVDFYVDLILF